MTPDWSPRPARVIGVAVKDDPGHNDPGRLGALTVRVVC